ncbi:hypothetical protein HMY34_04370 [Thiothrix subterranea]|uniref:hypothetical protein n=1 Tax=Thiothrix subterranea TaxID=2735563 RepID=UPI00192A6D43|nr:hypothetical protein [Thiothrix subterranea]QQZ28051.1 hypothetical protein HMY34_04370 [Thiothrix subterranea]
MKTQIVFKLSMACAAVMLLYGNAAHATEQDGVSCPSGYTVNRSSNNEELKCYKKYYLPTVCPPISHPLNVILRTTSGIDKCDVLVVGQSVDSAMAPPLPGYPPVSAFVRDINGGSGDADRFVAKEFAFPNGHNYPANHNKSKGVRCPANYDGYSTNRGIRCFVRDGEPKEAVCDVDEEMKRDFDGNQDRCRVGSSTLKTIPKGMTRSQFENDKNKRDVSWVLQTKSGKDTWQRKQWEYPESRK